LLVALIAYVPGLASWRILLGLGLLLVMAGLTWVLGTAGDWCSR